MAPRSSLALILSLLACIYVVNGVWTSPSLSRFEWWLQPSNGTAGEVLDHQPWVSLVRSNPGQPDDGEPYTLVSTGYWCVKPLTAGPLAVLDFLPPLYSPLQPPLVM